MKEKYLSILKSYNNYPSKIRYGINCKYSKFLTTFPLHHHDYFEIEFILNGKVEHELNGVKNIFKSGSCYGLGPNDFHQFTCTEDTTIYNICIRYKEAPPMVQKMLNSIKFPFVAEIPEENCDQFLSWFYKISEQIINSEEFCFEKITAYMILILSYIAEIEVPIQGNSLTAGYKCITEAIKYISKNISEPLTLSEVSSVVNLSPNYFSKIFTEIMGCTFVKYVTLQRIEYARKLLATTDKSITNIAFECGFGSFSSFSRAFRKMNGCRPYDFRNQARDN